MNTFKQNRIINEKTHSDLIKSSTKRYGSLPEVSRFFVGTQLGIARGSLEATHLPSLIAKAMKYQRPPFQHKMNLKRDLETKIKLCLCAAKVDNVDTLTASLLTVFEDHVQHNSNPDGKRKSVPKNNLDARTHVNTLKCDRHKVEEILRIGNSFDRSGGEELTDPAKKWYNRTYASISHCFTSHCNSNMDHFIERHGRIIFMQFKKMCCNKNCNLQ